MTRQRFIVVGAQRSGTTVTHVALRGHPQVTSLNDEVKVSPFFTEGPSTFTYGAETERERDRGWMALFDALSTLEVHETYGAARANGLKVAIHSHEEAVAFANCLRLRMPGIKVILVHRDDLVAQCGSWVRGQQSGQWHSWMRKESDSDAGVLKIDRDYFVDYAVESLGILAQLRTLNESHDVLEFSYERHIEHGAGWPELFEFVGLLDMPVSWLKSKKIAPSPEEYIENHEELRKALEEIDPPTLEAEQAMAMEHLVNSFHHRDEEAIVEAAGRRFEIDDPAPLHRLVLAAREDCEPWLAYFDARALVQNEKYEQAIPLYDQFLEGNPHTIALLHRAYAYVNISEFRAAQDDLATAIRTPRFQTVIRTTHQWAFEMLESCWGHLNDIKTAEHILAQTGDTLDDVAYFHYAQALVQNAMGDLEAGRASLRRALELAPDFERARDRLEQWEAY